MAGKNFEIHVVYTLENALNLYQCMYFYQYPLPSQNFPLQVLIMNPRDKRRLLITSAAEKNGGKYD